MPWGCLIVDLQCSADFASCMSYREKVVFIRLWEPDPHPWIYMLRYQVWCVHYFGSDHVCTFDSDLWISVHITEHHKVHELISFQTKLNQNTCSLRIQPHPTSTSCWWILAPWYLGVWKACEVNSPDILIAWQLKSSQLLLYSLNPHLQGALHINTAIISNHQSKMSSEHDRCQKHCRKIQVIISLAFWQISDTK